jgi:hypothetical protein
MDNYKDLEEANKEIERSKVKLHDIEKSANNTPEKAAETTKGDDEGLKEEGSGIFTADGKELPKIEGGYDFIEPGGSLGDDDFVST